MMRRMRASMQKREVWGERGSWGWGAEGLSLTKRLVRFKGDRPRPDSDVTPHSGDKVCARSEIDGCDVTWWGQVNIFERFFSKLKINDKVVEIQTLF